MIAWLIAGLLGVGALWLSLNWMARTDPARLKRTLLVIAGLCVAGAAGLILMGRAPQGLPLLLGAAWSFWRRQQLSRGSAGPGRGHAPPPPQRRGTMPVAEALEILGLSPGADEAAIRAAHRRLMQQLHPDKGGSDYLAQQINTARDTLLSALTQSGSNG